MSILIYFYTSHDFVPQHDHFGFHRYPQGIIPKGTLGERNNLNDDRRSDTPVRDGKRVGMENALSNLVLASNSESW